MSLNLIVRHSEGSLRLSRLSSRLTTTAQVGVGHLIYVEDIPMEVKAIYHHVGDKDGIRAPNSVVIAMPFFPGGKTELTERQVGLLKKYGFEEQ